MMKKETDKQADHKRNRRILIVGIVFTLCYMVIGARAFYLQVLSGNTLSERAVAEYTRDYESMGRRGNIYDAQMREMALTARVVSVAARPPRIEDPMRTAGVIAEILGMEQRRVAERLASDRPFVWIKRDASPSQARALSGAVPHGLDMIDSYSRIYPNRELAAQTLGFVGVDGNGLEGIEYRYDEYLRGRSYSQTVVRDALGRIFQRDEARTPDTEGKSMVLTIDANMQNIAEQAVARAVRQHNARSGMAVVMVPQTGEIRAVANHPSFNPNTYGSFPRSSWRNRAFTDSFEPGSAMKIFTAAAAMESGIDPLRLYVDCEEGRYRIGSNIVHDNQPHELLNLQEVIQYSSNIGIVKISEMMGSEALHATLGRFGFGRRTGVGFPGEASGMLRPHHTWRRIDNAAISFGQGISVTGVQLATAVSAIANGGTLMKPRLVKEIRNADGSMFRSIEPEPVRRAVTPEIAGQLKTMMAAATSLEGTGFRAVPEGYTVCGKTGTAQILTARGDYRDSDYYAIFAGFTPAHAPELAVVVAIEAPRGQYYGGEVAAPVFREIVRESFNYLDIPPVEPSPLIALEIAQPA